ncbi:MAG: nuclear transport factor 2 family protein, partial [Polyangiales bacterium]
MLRSTVCAGWAAVALSTISLSCATTAMSPPHATFDATTSERDVAAALDDFHDAAAHADEDRYFAHFAREGVFLGTDATERWDVPAFRAYAHARFVTGKGWTYRVQRRAIRFSNDGAVAWFDEDLLGEKAGPCRGSGVLVRVREGDRDRYL